MGRTYKEKRHGYICKIARMNRVGEDSVHIFVEDRRSGYGRLAEYTVAGGFFEGMRFLVNRYGCAWTRCDDRQFSY